jgi:flagellar hook protein FlgE
MLSAISSGLQGMNQGEDQVSQAAYQISSWGASAQAALNPPISQQPQPVTNDSVDLSTAAVNLLQGQDSFEASAKVEQAANEMSKQTISLVA